MRAVPSIPDFVPEVMEGYMPPYHLAPLTDRLERYDQEPLHLCFSVPPGHAKSHTLLAFIVKVLCEHPGWTVLYVTYGEDLAQEQSEMCQEMAVAAGLEIDPKKKRLDHWRIRAHGRRAGGARFVGFNQAITGRRADLIIVDDYVKSRLEAESETYRNRIHADFKASVYSRRRNGRVPVIVVATRWHEDDLIGRLVGGRKASSTRGAKWEEIRMPAISIVDDQERALWPELWDLESLLAIQETLDDEYEWSALYMASPIPKGQRLFRAATGYAAAPSSGRDAIGLDLAYTEGNASKFSVAVVLREGMDGIRYVMEVVRVQVQPEDFITTLQGVVARYPTARIRFYGSAVEMAQLTWIRKYLPKGVWIEGIPTVQSKYVRATPAALRWNKKGIQVPGGPDAPTWVKPFTFEIEHFTGRGDAFTDQVDALAGANDALESIPSLAKRKGGGPTAKSGRDYSHPRRV